MKDIDRTWSRCRRWLLAACVWASGTGAALAADPVGVSSALTGCRNNGTVVLPNASGQFICSDAAYTPGNLGKSWNELDLVPYRFTLQAGNSAPATQTYTLAVGVDYSSGGKPGYDVVSVPVLNATLSSPSCTTESVGDATLVTPGLGGSGTTSLMRTLTVKQTSNTTCVYDFYARLALGSHLYPGSSLHGYEANASFENAGGAKEISIPVKEIQPQSITKDMTASQGSDHAWNVVKSPAANDLAFGDVCRAGAPSSLPVTITVSWTKFAAVPGGPITVITHVYATNPAARTITTTVTDKIYSGTSLLDTSPSTTADVPGNTTNFLLLTHTYTAPAGTTDLNDVATATYTDKVTGVPIPGTSTATASAPVQATGSELNISAAIADSEVMTGNGLTFSVAAPSLGGFVSDGTHSAYVAGTQTVGPVIWAVAGQTDSGSITFNKTVYLANRTVTSGTLSDVANLSGIDGFTTSSNRVDIGISSSATVKFTLSKTIPILLANGESIAVNFHIGSTTDSSVSIDKTLTFGPGETSKSTPIDGLAPGVYTVTEGTSTFFYPGGPSEGVDAHLSPEGGPTKTVDLSVNSNGVVNQCSDTAAFVNRAASGQPRAQVQKVTFPTINSTDPDYTWTFTLSGPGVPGVVTQANANAGFVDFGIPLTALGTYTVVETQKTPLWVLTSATPDPTSTKVCTFEVTNIDVINGVIKQCTFVNTRQGKAQVIKTVSGGTPSGTQAFTFQLRQGASTTVVGTILESAVANAGNSGRINFSTYLVPGATYQICEVVMPGWLTTLGNFVPNSFNPPDGVATNPNVDNSILCSDFTVTAGQTKSFTVDNSPPPGGRALTIGFWKNWASCKKSGGKQTPVLDQTMAKAEPSGIQVDSFYLHGSTAYPNVAPDCAKAVNLLSKQNFDGVNKASDPLFNMAAQLVAAELNYTAGAYKCPAVTTAILQANALLTSYKFNGTTYTGKLNAADATLANNLAKRLDDYNNNRPGACL